MTFNEFQQECIENSAFKDNPNFDIRYWALALAGESGEVADEVKKMLRDDGWSRWVEIEDHRKELILNEMANVLFYLARMASNLNVNLEELPHRQIRLCIEKKNAQQKG
jgi:NTP pyrophosphatase (non-canonical NTP hydrolase)